MCLQVSRWRRLETSPSVDCYAQRRIRCYRSPMSNSLRSKLSDLADSFANSVLDAIRGASLEDLIAGGGNREPSRVRSAPTPKPTSKPTRSSSPGRLPRRSSEDIEQILDQVVSLVKSHKEGLRAEQIRSELGMQAKEMPRVLKEGLVKRKLRSKGQKRATTYFAA